MKGKMFIWAAAATVLLASCNKNEETGVQSVRLDKTTLTVEVGQTAQLTATVAPEGAAEVVWSSANPETATVDATGMVTGVTEGNAIIVATAGDKTANCMVQVVAEGQGEGGDEPGDDTGDLHPSLQGSDYFIFQMDAISAEKIAGKIVADYRVDDTNCFLDIWNAGETYTAGTTSGLNFYGEAESWVSFIVAAPAGWSGGGYRCTDLDKINALTAIFENPEDYYFHIGMKSTDNASHVFRFGGSISKGGICIGSTAFNDNGVVYQPKGEFTRDGSWGEIEICMKEVVDAGWATAAITSTDGTFYPLEFISGGVKGTMLQYDACFIYKKAATAE